MLNRKQLTPRQQRKYEDRCRRRATPLSDYPGFWAYTDTIRPEITVHGKTWIERIGPIRLRKIVGEVHMTGDVMRSLQQTGHPEG